MYTHIQMNTAQAQPTITVADQTHIPWLVAVVFRVDLLSHGTKQGGIHFNMIMLGEACLGPGPSPCAQLQI